MLSRKTLALLWSLIFLFACDRADADDIIKRSRVSYTGTIIRNALSNGETSVDVGDLIAINVEASSGEEITVQAHMYAVSAPDFRPPEVIDASNLKPVKSALPGYVSKSLPNVVTATTSARVVHDPGNSTHTALVYMPYKASAFDHEGIFYITYRLRIWVGDTVVDDYFMSYGAFTESSRHKSKRTYRLAASQGPNVDEFSLKNADDPNQ